MDIGKEKPARIVEPIENPVPERREPMPTPVPKRAPSVSPERVPVRV